MIKDVKIGDCVKFCGEKWKENPKGILLSTDDIIELTSNIGIVLDIELKFNNTWFICLVEDKLVSINHLWISETIV